MTLEDQMTIEGVPETQPRKETEPITIAQVRAARDYLRDLTTIEITEAVMGAVLEAACLPIDERTPAMSAAGFCISEAEHDPAGVYRAMIAARPQGAAATMPPVCEPTLQQFRWISPTGETSHWQDTAAHEIAHLKKHPPSMGGHYEFRNLYEAPMLSTEAMDFKALVDRFLAWPLPDSVCSDGCVTERGYPNRSGTNLLTASEAEAMLRHVLAARSSSVEAGAGEDAILNWISERSES